MLAVMRSVVHAHTPAGAAARSSNNLSWWRQLSESRCCRVRVTHACAIHRHGNDCPQVELQRLLLTQACHQNRVLMHAPGGPLII